MIKLLALFASSIVLVLVGHALVYLAFTDLFAFFGGFPKTFFISALAVLFISIIISSLLIHYRDNVFTRFYYIFSAVWTSLLLHFVLSYLVVLILRWMLLLFNYHLNPIVAAVFFIFLVIASSLWGLFNALSPQIVRADLQINRLPAAWDGKKIVQLSDVHLGPVYREKFLGKIVNLVNSENPDLILITGDLFDGMDGDFKDVHGLLGQLKAHQGVYFVYGNHENYFGRVKSSEIIKGAGIEILDNRLVDIDGLQIIGISYPEEKDFDLAKIITSLRLFDAAKPKILMFHEPKQIAPVAKTGIDLFLAGHTHYGQLFPFNFLTDFLYHGYAKGLKKSGDMQIFTSTGVGTWGPPLRTLSRSEIPVFTLRLK